MNEFKKYKRLQFAEMRPVTQNDLDNLDGGRIGIEIDNSYNIVSISQQDRMDGSPKIGDMIARNPKNVFDMWLVNEQYFKDNFEPCDG